VLVRTRLTPASLAAVRTICEEEGKAEATVLRELIESALEARGEATCRVCRHDISGMPAYYQGVPRERCDVCEELVNP
jgi:hypothetical protein